MTRWAPWLLALLVWNGAFDLQVRRAGERFTEEQVERWRRQTPLPLIRDAFVPRVREAAVRSSIAAIVVLVAGLAWRRRDARASHR